MVYYMLMLTNFFKIFLCVFYAFVNKIRCTQNLPHITLTTPTETMIACLTVCCVLIITCITLLLMRRHVNPRWLEVALRCHYCKCNRAWCALINLSKVDLSDYSNKYTQYIPNWLLHEVKLNTKRRWYKIDDFIMTQNRCYNPQNRLYSILFGTHISFVAYWISSELQTISPLFNPSQSTQKIKSKLKERFKLYTTNEWMEIFKCQQSDQLNTGRILQISEGLGWSKMKKSKNYLSTIADLKYHHIQLLKQILYKGKQFHSNLSGVHPDHIYCYAHVPATDVYATLHIHFSNKLELLEMYRVYVSGKSIFLENVIQSLENNGNIAAVLNSTYVCKHYSFKNVW